MIADMDSRRPAHSPRSESLRAIVKALIAADFDGNQQAAATTLGVTRATINQFINGHKGAGQPICDGLPSWADAARVRDVAYVPKTREG